MRTRSSTVRSSSTALCAGACVASLLCGTGCYERTVFAQGMGAKHTTVQKGYRSDTSLDRWWDREVMGKKPVQRRPGGTVPTIGPAPSDAARRTWTTQPNRE